MMAIAATGNSYYAYEAGRISAEESRAVGIHFNLAPVVDVNNNPKNPIINTRSFGEVPDSVQKYSKDFIKGLKDFGMLTTAKHFPGHGDTETDSHSALAMIPSDSARLSVTASTTSSTSDGAQIIIITPTGKTVIIDIEVDRRNCGSLIHDTH